MASTSRRDARFTYDDLVQLPEDGMRHEIIDGVHFVTPSPVKRHQRLARRVLVAIDRYLEERPGFGEVFHAPFDTLFSPFDVVVPDVLLVAGDQLDILTEKNVAGAPALVVEVLSPGTKRRDIGVKRQLYDRGGVREYWIVDPDANAVTIYRRSSDGSFPLLEVLTSPNVALTTPLLPEFSLQLDILFRN
jgi:Uma2 family endonuclease